MNEYPTSLISRLEGMLDGLSANECRIAQAILDDPSAVTLLSSQALANRCQVSQSSIIKFCKKIGLAGFPALKIALSAEVARSEGSQQIHGDIFSDDSLGAVARKMFDSKVSALSETLKLNSNADLMKAVDLVENAQRIIVFGVGGSAIVASDLASKLTKLGKAVVQGGDGHIQLANLASFGRDDLLIAISYSGKSNEVNVAAEYARTKKTPSILLGAFTDPIHQNGSAVLLRCKANENLVRSSSIANRTAQFAVTDLLFILLAQQQDDLASRISESQRLAQKIK